jgi:hypothetical protein
MDSRLFILLLRAKYLDMFQCIALFQKSVSYTVHLWHVIFLFT